MTGIDREVLARAVEEVRRATGDPVIAGMFERSMAENLPAVAERLPDGTTFVLTGDIPAMWLRDSATQLRPYLVLCGDDPGLAGHADRRPAPSAGVHRDRPVRERLQRGPTTAPHTADETEMSPWVWERKYEIDSLCFPVSWPTGLWRITGRNDVHRRALRRGGERDPRPVDGRAGPRGALAVPVPAAGDRPSDTLVRDGPRARSQPTGMTWSGFRPSDDACRATATTCPATCSPSVVARLPAADRDRGRCDDDALADRAERAAGGHRATGIARHGVVDHPATGAVYAYEVDGLGGALADGRRQHAEPAVAAARGLVRRRRPAYLATRAAAAQPGQPVLLQRYGGEPGIGSPHTPPGHVWPIALAVQALTSTSAEDRRALLDLLRDTTRRHRRRCTSVPRRRPDGVHPPVVLMGERDVLRALAHAGAGLTRLRSRPAGEW